MMMELTPDQQHIRNVAMRTIEAIKQDENPGPALMEDLVKTVANALIDLNRAANAMEIIAAAMLAGQKPSGKILKP